MYFYSLIIKMLISGIIIFMTMLTEKRKLKIMEKFISKQSINIFDRKWHIYFS